MAAEERYAIGALFAQPLPYPIVRRLAGYLHVVHVVILLLIQLVIIHLFR